MAPAPAMENACGNLLPYARRSGDQDAAARPGDALERRADVVDRGAGPGQFVGRAGFFAELFIFELQPLILGSTRDEMEQALGLKGLFDEVECPAADRGDRSVESPCPEITMIGKVGSNALIASTRPNPSSRDPCNHTSISASDGRRWRIASSAASLSDAVRAS